MNQEITPPAEFSDELEFLSEIDAGPQENNGWKVLIVDDDADVHTSTKLACRRFTYKDRGIDFFDAYSGKEACELLQQHPDIAVVFLDVVMETDDAGLVVAKRIREQVGNAMVRIILRTGQPGYAPEERVVRDYDIHDYKAKSEMTANKLYTSLVSALRTFQDLQTIDTNRRALIKILDASSSMDFRSRCMFISGLLMQLGSLLEIENGDMTLIRRAEGGRENCIVAAYGGYEAFIGETAKDILDAESNAQLTQVFQSRNHCVNDREAIYLISVNNLSDAAVLINSGKKLSDMELNLLMVFCRNIVLSLNNFEDIEHARRDANVEATLISKLANHARQSSIDNAINLGRMSREIATLVLEKLPRESIESRLPEWIERAALFADLGNHAIPKEILNKPSALNAEEMAIIRTHPELGVSLLDEVLAEVKGGHVISFARQIILAHQESFDGSGYPLQLTGTDIPLPARIVAVADCFIALTSTRPWRESFSHDDAVAMISAESGRKYDPMVVTAFLAVAEDFRQVQ